MWSPTVAKHDQTRTVAGSRPASSAARFTVGDAALQRLVGEEGVQDDVVERAAAERERVRAEGDEAERDVLVEVRVEAEHGQRPGRPVVADDVSPCQSRRISPAKSSICAVVIRGMPKTSNIGRCRARARA